LNYINFFDIIKKKKVGAIMEKLIISSSMGLCIGVIPSNKENNTEETDNTNNNDNNENNDSDD